MLRSRDVTHRMKKKKVLAYIPLFLSAIVFGPRRTRVINIGTFCGRSDTRYVVWDHDSGESLSNTKSIVCRAVDTGICFGCGRNLAINNLERK